MPERDSTRAHIHTIPDSSANGDKSEVVDAVNFNSTQILDQRQFRVTHAYGGDLVQRLEKILLLVQFGW